MYVLTKYVVMHYLKNEGARPCALRYLLSFRPEGLYYIVRYPTQGTFLGCILLTLT